MKTSWFKTMAAAMVAAFTFGFAPSAQAEREAVQLWEGGPYFATCNVGAEKPTDYGYYFWWGDTVGYTNTVGKAGGEGTWYSVADGKTVIEFDYDPPASSSKLSHEELKERGYIDDETNPYLNAAHDAATAHWGKPWRMPTNEELNALVEKIENDIVKLDWIEGTNGVNGVLLTGTGTCAGNSIFLPAAGRGYYADLQDPGRYGYYWSSVPDLEDSRDFAWSYLVWPDEWMKGGGGFYGAEEERLKGLSIRPVRDTPPVTKSAIITMDEVSSHYPWDGKVDCVTTLSGLESGEEYEGVFTLSVKKGGVTVRQTVTNAFASVDGTYTNTFDCATLFGAGFYPNGGITVTLVKKEKVLDGVQLWAGGPYFATCNVGAEKPTDYGYYFWWGDTVGYTNTCGQVTETTSGTWYSVADGKTAIKFDYYEFPADSSRGEPADLQEMGYIDDETNPYLNAAHDAATARWEKPWRMPTDEEMNALAEKVRGGIVQLDWIEGTNGVNGALLTGTGTCAGNSIFLPAVGHGYGADLESPGYFGYYWSSMPNPDNPDFAMSYVVCSESWEEWGRFFRWEDDRCRGIPIRPVRDAE